jgi:hypothetical protein
MRNIILSLGLFACAGHALDSTEVLRGYTPETSKAEIQGQC